MTRALSTTGPYLAAALSVAATLTAASQASAQDDPSPSPAGAHAADEAEAAEAAAAWLTLVDSGAYARSHETASAAFRDAVSPEAWEQSVTSARVPLGALDSRELASSEFRSSLPNAPAGDYVLVLYRSSFAQLERAVETVVMMRDTDGAWRVGGYFVRPAQGG